MSTIWPGATIGIIGGGQLGRMIAFEAKRMGYRVAVLDPNPDAPAAQVADVCVQGAIDDVQAARTLAQQSDVVTIDTEHVPATLLAAIAEHTQVRPGAHALNTVQDRLSQRRFLQAHGLPQTRFTDISTEDDVTRAHAHVDFPAVLKTRRDGYDGKGQVRVQTQAELRAAWRSLNDAPCVLEAFVHFTMEVSAVLARGADGTLRAYDVAENHHRRHILHATRVPATLDRSLVDRAQRIGATIATAMDHVGMLAVELFVTTDGQLLVNEIAPRTHNSGHYTFGACATSQFEQHVRAICGLPLGDTTLLRPAVMLNLLGDAWHEGQPDWSVLLAHPTARLHIYGKRVASRGRKMGHVLVLDSTIDAAWQTANQIADALEAGHPAAADAQAARR